MEDSAKFPDYNLCMDCKDAGVHPPEHRLFCLETPEDGLRDEAAYVGTFFGHIDPNGF